MKKTLIVAGVVALAITLGWMFIHSRALSGSLAESIGAYNLLKKESAVVQGKQQQIIEDQVARIAEKDAIIADLNHDIIDDNDAIVDQDRQLAALRKKLDGLTDCPSKLANLDEQISLWSNKFTLCERASATKDSIIFNLTEKYDAQVAITDAVYAQLADCVKVKTSCEEALQKAVSQLKTKKFVGYVKTGVIVAAVGFIAYSLVKK